MPSSPKRGPLTIGGEDDNSTQPSTTASTAAAGGPPQISPKSSAGLAFSQGAKRIAQEAVGAATFCAKQPIFIEADGTNAA